MSFRRIYLDYAATTPVDERVISAMLPFWRSEFGNPSSSHRGGHDALNTVESARAKIASILGAEPEEIIFTGSGTEADNIALKSVALAKKDDGNHIITSAIEHDAVLRSCEFLEKNGFEVTYLPVSGEGIVDPDDVRKSIRKSTIIVSIMHANNEIGTIQPIEEIGQILEDKDIFFHSDAVQTFGHENINVNKIGLDMLSLSGHKFYGPKGIGALYLRKGVPFVPLLHGGGQEKGVRSSTLNVPGIAGMVKAAEISARELDEENLHIAKLRDQLLGSICNNIERVYLNGSPSSRLVNNINISVEGIDAESFAINLDLEGISISNKSACGSKSVEPSHVLTAIGLSRRQAGESLRLTLGRYTTEYEIEITSKIMIEIVSRLRSQSV